MEEYQEAQKIYELCKKALYSRKKEFTIELLNQLINHKEKYPSLSKFLNRNFRQITNTSER